jgi:hypothetical protein
MSGSVRHEGVDVRSWVAAPQHTDDQVRAKTGRDWDTWVTEIDTALGRATGHPEIAQWLRTQGVDDWWAQAVAVGYERIIGRRLPGQVADGTFTISRSRILPLTPAEAQSTFLDDDQRARLLVGFEVPRLSRDGVVTPRFDLRRGGRSLGHVQFSAEAATDSRTSVTVTHSRLATADEGDHWKRFWSSWLNHLAEVKNPL